MSTEALVETLVEQVTILEGWPDPHLLAEILARGSEAVEPLRALLQREYEEWPEIEVLSFAAELLGSLGDSAAIPDLLGLFRRVDDDVLENVSTVLGEFGPQIIEPALEIARDESLPWFPRSSICDAAIEAAGDDAVARTTIAQGLREILADCLRKSEEADARATVAPNRDVDVSEDEEDNSAENVDELDDEEEAYDSDVDEDTLDDEDMDELEEGEADGARDDFVEIATMMVNDLADLADPLARDLIAAAYEADIIDGWLIPRDHVEETYRQGGRISGLEREPFLTRYEREYAAHQKNERRRADEKLRRPASPPVSPEAEPEPLPPALQPIRNTAPRPKRNDPCWCGSGKKYKQCHLRADEA